ncbi:MAG: 50S ribosomal protein L20 [Candidatus Pacebacteria bacterium]|jgi:large subunit ribosomal protein L20|nr:50S ribosomal protein L20 [Candidatus Paceibacterota bacterium]
MTRVKRGTIKNKRRRKILSQTKGYRFGRSTKEAQAREAIRHAGAHAFAHRKDKKADKRALWQTNISASAKALGISYSKLIGALKKKDILLDRKILADLAKNHPEVFARIVKAVM